MESASMSVKKIHILRIDPRRRARIGQAIPERGEYQAGRGVGGYGTLAAYHLHWVMHNRIPTDNLFRRGEGGIELLSMNGLVVEGEPHIHITLSMPDGAFGGHLEPGCIAYVV